MTFFTTGRLPDGSGVPNDRFVNGSETPSMPWAEVRAVATDYELRSMYAYLHSLPPVEGPRESARERAHGHGTGTLFCESRIELQRLANLGR